MNRLLKTATLFTTLFSGVAFACTTVGWISDHGMIVSRTQDWMEGTSPTLTRIPTGATRNTHGIPTGDEYLTKYTVAGILAYQGLVHDGVNEKGLQMNGLFYRPMTMPPAQKGSISQLELGGYMLAMYGSVEEAVNALKDLKVGTVALPGAPTTILLHWAITDPTGDRAVIQYDPDGLKIYRGEDAMVMTNQPSQQVHLDNTKKIEDFDSFVDFGAKGNSNSQDRFKSATYYLAQLDGSTSPRNAMMKLAGIPFKVPQDAVYLLNGEKTTYATEWQMTTNLKTGDTAFSYHFDDTWLNMDWNYQTIITDSTFKPLPLYK